MTTVNNIPSIQSPIVDSATGYGTAPWIQFFAGLTAPAQAISPITLGASPFSFTASAAGNLAVSGGTVTSITITRARTTISTGVTQGLIPLSQGDIATVTYTGTPTFNFLPSAGIGSTRRS